MHHKFHFVAVALVNEERLGILTVVGDTEFLLNVLERQNVGDGILMESHLAVIPDESLLVGIVISPPFPAKVTESSDVQTL